MNYYLLNVFDAEAIPNYLQHYLGKPDPRVEKWFLLNSLSNLLIIYLVYAILILGGKQIMKNRKPFRLKQALIVYNSFQIVFSIYICKEVFLCAYLSGYKLPCTHLDVGHNTLTIRMATAFWYFYLSKVIDLMDTMFFVLRKRNSQLTFLHIYHHSSMICNWYFGVLYVPGGQAFFSVGVNSFVHVIMYTYYLLSAMGAKMRKYLWWKKYLTQVQLIQFAAVMIHLYVGSKNGCTKPLWLVRFTITYLWTLVLLFANFYLHTYKQYEQSKATQVNLKRKLLPAKHYMDLQAGGDMKRE